MVYFSPSAARIWPDLYVERENPQTHLKDPPAACLRRKDVTKEMEMKGRKIPAAFIQEMIQSSD